MAEKSLHSICRWTFNPGKGGFVPGDMRPEWGGVFGTPDMIKLVSDKIAPRLPDHIELDIEIHYDPEVNEKKATEVAKMQIDWVCHVDCGALPCLGHCPDTLVHSDISQQQQKLPETANQSGPRIAAFFIAISCLLVLLARMISPRRFDNISIAFVLPIMLCVGYLLLPKQAWSRIKQTIKAATLKTRLFEIRVDKSKNSEAEGGNV